MKRIIIILSILLSMGIDNCLANSAHSLVSEAKTYYLSSSLGDDSNDGSIENPWKTLAKISSVTLSPGDRVLFKCDDRFDGHLVVNGSGSLDEPIYFGGYASGGKPIITGEVGANNGGDYQEAILVENCDNMIFESLEINNERKTTRSGVDDVDAYGIQILNSGTKPMKNLTFRNMTFQNVFAVKEMNDPDDFNGLEVAGLRFFSLQNRFAGQEKNIQNVLVEECFFKKIQRLGIHVKHAGGKDGIGNDSINANLNLVFRNNEFHYLGGTCILPSRTYNCLIEDNLFNHPGDDSDPRMPGRGSSVWTWRCFNTVIQRNECLHIRGYLDSHGIHIDHENHNTFVQYNYMEDCEGGFVEILGGNVNAVYRFNVSVNDGWRQNPNWINSNHTLWINEKVPNGVHYCDSSYIYNNTIVIDKPYETAIDMDAKNTHIFNNIFYAVGGAGIGSKQVSVKNNNTPLFMKNNLFFGNVATSFRSMDGNPVLGDPQFATVDGSMKYHYQLKKESAAINAGLTKTGPPIPGAGHGIFKNVPKYPTVDFYGNPIDLSKGTPNVGACNAKAGETTTFTIIIEQNNRFKAYPVPVKDFLNIEGIAADCQFEIVSLSGELIYKGIGTHRVNIQNVKRGVYVLNVAGDRSYKILKI